MPLVVFLYLSAALDIPTVLACHMWLLMACTTLIFFCDPVGAHDAREGYQGSTPGAPGLGESKSHLMRRMSPATWNPDRSICHRHDDMHEIVDKERKKMICTLYIVQSCTFSHIETKKNTYIAHFLTCSRTFP